MNKLLLLTFVTLPFFSYAQENDELIYWASGHKLTWDDYKGSTDAASGAAASTATYLGIDYNFGPQGFTYKITCSFSKTRSWGLHKNDHILGHEQGHFDIAEVFARKLNKNMKSYKFNPDTYKTDLQKIYQDILDEKEKIQDLYDEETDHSIIMDKQAEWLKKIDQLLNEYKAYAKYN
jgi:hypothetical protein